MTAQKALFLDRDGVINIDHGYVSKVEDFIFTEGIFELLELFSKKGYLLFIVTNQSGIGRGYYSLENFTTLTRYMLDSLHENNITIEEVQYCPHAPEDNCICRKPKTGMIDTIKKRFSIDLNHSWLIGDKQSDIDLAHNSCIHNTIAITPSKLDDATYHFDSIKSCLTFLHKNASTLL